MVRTRIPLNGYWQVAPGTRDVLPEAWSGTLPVPGLLDLTEPAYDWASNDYHWYRTVFLIPKDVAFTIAFLRIEQAMFGTAVWLNGNPVGCDIACYTLQEYDVRKALKRDAENELLVRVGLKSTLPPESAVGKDQERSEFIPGIWGDVELVLTGNPRIKLVQIIPHINTGIAEARFWIENASTDDCRVEIAAGVREKSSGRVCALEQRVSVEVKAGSEHLSTLEFPIEFMTMWSPDSPFLYEVDARIQNLTSTFDQCTTTFGMREFRVSGGDLLLNGKKILLRGGNIAFHRFLSDADRGTLPWNLEWVKKLLIDIPKAHNFNFFRNHLGQMYNRWYDIADEHGMLLQNEWQFWTTTGSKEQITKEFTCWLHDNWNHPSVIIWDALNECSDDIVQKEIIPAMKELDPTRPWESVDFVEQHPYIYSLGPVLNNRQFGFTRSMPDIENMKVPSVVNEFLWWWLDKDWKPTTLTQDVILRWLGRDYTEDELIERQSFLAQELVELFRRMDVDAIQPFVYLSNNAGPTANWFVGHVKDLQPKPVMKSLTNAFAPFGVSIELWDRHFFPGEHRTVRIFLFNDRQTPKSGVLRCGILNSQGEWVFETTQQVTVDATRVNILPMTIPFPHQSGMYSVRAELSDRGECLSYSQKVVHVIRRIDPSHCANVCVALLEEDPEIGGFLTTHGITVVPLEEADLQSCNVVVVSGGEVFGETYQSRLGALRTFLHNGKSVILIEPEYGIVEKETVNVALSTELIIERRKDTDRGGYDSYVFAEDIAHPLWKGIDKEHLKMFNGGYGGEVVSEHTIRSDVAHTVLARCGLNLNIAAVMEIPYGTGKIIVSRLQLRGRLAKTVDRGFYKRRSDPVLQQYLLNLISYAST